MAFTARGLLYSLMSAASFAGWVLLSLLSPRSAFAARGATILSGCFRSLVELGASLAPGFGYEGDVGIVM